jgi:hypothetical protein
MCAAKRACSRVHNAWTTNHIATKKEAYAWPLQQYPFSSRCLIYDYQNSTSILSIHTLRSAAMLRPRDHLISLKERARKTFGKGNKADESRSSKDAKAPDTLHEGTFMPTPTPPLLTLDLGDRFAANNVSAEAIMRTDGLMLNHAASSYGHNKKSSIARAKTLFNLAMETQKTAKQPHRPEHKRGKSLLMLSTQQVRTTLPSLCPPLIRLTTGFD